MNKYPEYFENEKELEEAISRPTDEVIKMIKETEGDFIFLGVAGKMGVSMAIMAKRACSEAGIIKRIIGVSRFSDSEQQFYLDSHGIETIKGDLLDHDFVKNLPDVKNVIYLAGMKFGTDGNEAFTWAMNSYLPGIIVERYKDSRIVALSTGCVYPLVKIDSGGSKETDNPNPVGEYAQSCLGRERLFEYGSLKYGTKVSNIRLYYSVEMRYGVLVDLAQKVFNEEPIDLTMGHANVIWQGDANALILQAINYCDSPAKPLNITGPETLSIREVALQFGVLMGKQVKLVGDEATTALLGNADLSFEIMNKPKISLDQVIKWTAKWIADEKRLLGKPTHFEVRNGKY